MTLTHSLSACGIIIHPVGQVNCTCKHILCVFYQSYNALCNSTKQLEGLFREIAKAFITVSSSYWEVVINNGADIIIIILQKHWPWLFELSILANIQPDFTYCTVFNWLLNPDSDLQHRCEGVAILWKKCIICSTIHVNDCDRISGIRIPLNDQRSFSILGAYLPSVNRVWHWACADALPSRNTHVVAHPW